MAKGKSRKTPQRMCVSCREMKDKKALFRLVADDETVSYDPSGKKAGRGAYVCKSETCLTDAVRKGKLRYHLKQDVPESLLEELLAELAREEAREKPRRKRVVRLGADGTATVVEEGS